MRYPSKVTSFSESTISRFRPVLEALEDRDLTVRELYRKVKSKTGGVDEYLDILDCLFALGKIEKLPGGAPHYVD